jgi:hypothetical protein
MCARYGESRPRNEKKYEKNGRNYLNVKEKPVKGGKRRPRLKKRAAGGAGPRGDRSARARFGLSGTPARVIPPAPPRRPHGAAGFPVPFLRTGTAPALFTGTKRGRPAPSAPFSARLSRNPGAAFGAAGAGALRLRRKIAQPVAVFGAMGSGVLRLRR